jgi:hypothetical protein
MGSVSLRDLPTHHSFIAFLAFTKVSSRDSPFPRDDPGAPFHKCDFVVPIKSAGDPESLPLRFRVEKPVGYYYLVLRVTMAREIRGKLGFQIENFLLGTGPVELPRDGTVTLNGSVTWPSIADDDLHEYGRLEDLKHGGT